MTTADAYIPPQNLEAEESVLGAMMVSETAVASVIVDVHLLEEDFYRQGHRIVFKAVHSLHSKGDPVDALTVTEQLTQTGELTEAGGKELVQSLASTVPVAGNADHYAKIVKANAMLRRLLGASQKIQKSVHEREGEPRDLVEQAERMLFEVAHSTASQDFASLSDILVRETTRLEELSEGKRDLTGTPSGFIDLDNLTGGFQPGNLIIIAARPSMGKSSLVANIAENVAVDKGLPVAFFSLEMSETELAHRFLASQARIPGEKLRKGQIKQDWNKILKASNRLEQAPIWLDTSSDLSILELRAKSRRLYSREGGLGLIIVDYMQLMRADDPRQSRVEQVGAISRGLKLLAGELNVPVIALSQLSRAPEQRPDKRPILSDLRESGNLEQDADLVAFIFRQEYYDSLRSEDEHGPGGGPEPSADNKGKAELILAKHRNGPVGNVELAFLAPYPKFQNLYKGGRGAAPSVPTATGADAFDPAEDPIDLDDDGF